MKAADLRKSILQAAVQGKLLPQDKNDEPASELLKRIQVEKAALIKAGKLKKGNRLPPITENEIPYNLPEGWMWCRLGNVVYDVFTGPFGSMLHKSDYVEHGTPLVNPMNIVDERIVPLQRMQVDEDTKKRLGSYVLRKGNVVVARRGELGRCAIVDDAEDGWLCGTGSFFIKLPNSIFPRYFTLVFRSIQTVRQLSNNSIGATMSNLNHSILKAVLVSIPPLTEQHRIVSKVDELMILCNELEVTEKELDALEGHFAEDLPKSILQAAVQGKLVPQDKNDEPASELLKRIQVEKAALVKEGKLKKEKPLPSITENEIPYNLPEEWVWCRLDDIAIKPIKRGKSPAYAASGSALVFAQKCNTKSGKIDLSLSLYLDESMLPKYPDSEFMIGNDIIINSTGKGTLGRVGIYRSDDNPHGTPVVPDSHVTVIRAISNINVDYVFYCLKAYQPFMEKLGSGSTNQTELSANIVKSLLFPLPPLAEQQRIVAKVDELMALCEGLKHVDAQPIDHSNVLSFPVKPETEDAEPIQMAAQGKVASQPSKQHTAALDDLLGMMDDD